ncbi:D-aminoacyl-tRNA deacylase [Gottschalkiaceae bacterium SANA]|nr:D-aminoacyl-tRNA deacylase [Gottschalkiaceae bacterium SANA]
MRAVVQRVKSASVEVNQKCIGKIEKGLLIYLGISHDDESSDLGYMADKISHLRIFEDEDEKMNRSLLDEKGEILLVSQFTLYGDVRKGRRPSFIQAARPKQARPLYEELIALLKERGIVVARGEFGADMKVSSVNDGPVTLLLDSKKGF